MSTAGPGTAHSTQDVVWKPELRPCPVCGHDRYSTLGRRGGGAHRLGLGLETTIVRCRACHAVYPRPAFLPLSNPYEAAPAEAYFAAHCREEKIANGRQLARKAACLRGSTGRLLELGCGRGELLQGARQEGWTVAGVDLTAAFARQAENLEIEVAPVETARSLEARYDAIYLAAVLEHLYTPLDTLARCAGALVPGGVLFIDVPDECGPWTRLGNLYMRLRGRDWAVNLSPTFAPYHVVGFCRVSLAHALRESGLEVVEMAPYSIRVSLLGARGVAGQVEKLFARSALRLTRWLGFGDGILCWARKPGV